MLSDLRESGAIEQDADIVIFVYRPDMYKDCPKEIAGQNIAEIIVAKHRNGPQGTVKVKWIGETTTFVNLEKDANTQSLEGTEPPEPNKVTLPDENLPDIVPLDESSRAAFSALLFDEKTNAVLSSPKRAETARLSWLLNFTFFAEKSV